MSMFQFDEPAIRPPAITVVGVGGGGGNAVRNMVDGGVDGVDFLAVNTDRQVLETLPIDARIQIGAQTTRGMGAGSDPNVGQRAAIDDQARIADALQAADMCVLTAGLGGGTGTGAAPVVAKLARERGALTVAVVTMPFRFEGQRRQAVAQWGLEQLRQTVDTLLVIPNDRVLAVAERGTRFKDAFKLIDNVVLNAVQSISEIITVPGYINVDFNDVRAIMRNSGRALMGTGRASGEDRAREAAELAIASPLLDGASIDGATGILICITGGEDLEIHEAEDAASVIEAAAHPQANIIFGTAFDPTMEGEIKVTVIATGFDREPQPVVLDNGHGVQHGLAHGHGGHSAAQPAPMMPMRAYEDAYTSDARTTDRFASVQAPAAVAPRTTPLPQTIPGLDRPYSPPSEMGGRQARVSGANPATTTVSGGWGGDSRNDLSLDESLAADGTQPSFLRRRLDDFRR